MARPATLMSPPVPCGYRADLKVDALMAALVAALLTQTTDRSAWLAAMLGTRFARPGIIIAAIAIALCIVNALAAIGGALIAPVLSPNAKALLLALRAIVRRRIGAVRDQAAQGERRTRRRLHRQPGGRTCARPGRSDAIHHLRARCTHADSGAGRGGRDDRQPRNPGPRGNRRRAGPRHAACHADPDRRSPRCC